MAWMMQIANTAAPFIIIMHLTLDGIILFSQHFIMLLWWENYLKMLQLTTISISAFVAACEKDEKQLCIECE